MDDKLLPFPFDETAIEGIAKSGNTFNHKLLWEHIKPCNMPFDYYPRGTVFTNHTGYLDQQCLNNFCNKIIVESVFPL